VSVPVWVAELSSAFWAEAGQLEPFPRNLRRPIAKAVSLTVVSLPKLSIAIILKWLEDFDISCELGSKDRPVRACLVARHGWGIAFVDGSDPDAEQRFSVAHELAHFLREYWHVRQQVCRKIGRATLDVLDGKRPPTTDERIQAMLRSTAIGFRVHLMERDCDGNLATGDIADAERAADRLAYELLAPAEHVCANSAQSNRGALAEKLRQFYGLPELQAARYAGILLPVVHVDPLIHRLRNLA
jgi:hypothetical protein